MVVLVQTAAKKFLKNFSALKRGSCTGINCQENIFLNFGTKPEELGFFIKISELISLR
jgi:hypothetical protein